MNQNLRFATLALLSLPLAAQGQSSNLPRQDLQLSTTNGVHNGGTTTSNLDAGFTMFDCASPKQDLPDRTGGLVATSRLVYTVFADRVGGDVVLQFRKSTDGGRNFAAPVTIYTCNTAGGEDLEGSGTNDAGEELALTCWGDDLYVTFLTNKDAIGLNPSAYQSLYAIGSNDQGQTWSAPVLVSPGIGITRGDVDYHRAAAASTGLHVTYEWDYFPAGGNENFSYARLGFVGGVFGTIVPSTDITTFPNAGFDVNDPSVDAEGDVVHIAWNDNSDPVIGTTRHQTWSVTSFDAGATFSLPHNHTNHTAPTPWATERSPFAHVDGPYAYTFMEDSRVDQDDVWMDRGILDTVTHQVLWQNTGIMCSDLPNGPGGASPNPQLDVDGFVVDVQNGVIAILYKDDRTGATNSNWGHLAVSRNYGDDFVNGTASHFTLTNVTVEVYDVSVNGNVICAVYEQCAGSSNEEGGITLSSDSGMSVTSSQFTTRGSCSSPASTVDVDDLRCSVSRNGDYTVVYVDERAGNSNTVNNCFLTGGKFPVLRDQTLVNGTLEMSRIDTAEAGTNLAFLMISAAGTQPGHAVFGNTYGFFVGLNNDLWFNLLMNSVTSTFAGISPAGDTVFTIPGGIPNLTALLGFPIDVAGGTLSFGPRLFVSYSDPVRF